jgi:preprotein translocase subunit SecE
MAVEVARPNFFQRAVTFYHEVMAELRKVTWPDRPQVQDATIKILIFVLFVGLVIALLDVVLQQVLVRAIPAIFGVR